MSSTVHHMYASASYSLTSNKGLCVVSLSTGTKNYKSKAYVFVNVLRCTCIIFLSLGLHSIWHKHCLAVPQNVCLFQWDHFICTAGVDFLLKVSVVWQKGSTFPSSVFTMISLQTLKLITQSGLCESFYIVSLVPKTTLVPRVFGY